MTPPRFTVRRLMIAIGLAASLLWAGRFIAIHLPHARECWRLASYENKISEAYRRSAAKYRACIRAVPCTDPEYCYNACLKHVNAPGGGRPIPSYAERAQATE